MGGCTRCAGRFPPGRWDALTRIYAILVVRRGILSRHQLRMVSIMKRFLLVVMFGLLLCAPSFSTTSKAIGINIDLGDRQYYNHGPYYYGPHRERLYWVPGHWSRSHHHRVWVHGRYVRR